MILEAQVVEQPKRIRKAKIALAPCFSIARSWKRRRRRWSFLVILIFVRERCVSLRQAAKTTGGSRLSTAGGTASRVCRATHNRALLRGRSGIAWLLKARLIFNRLSNQNIKQRSSPQINKNNEGTLGSVWAATYGFLVGVCLICKCVLMVFVRGDIRIKGDQVIKSLACDAAGAANIQHLTCCVGLRKHRTVELRSSC